MSDFLVIPEKAYTILIPVDSAFQRWHPIDWGFYPFSVSEFTESVLRNHFLQLKAPIRMQDIKRATEISKVKTMGGELVSFRSYRNYHLKIVENIFFHKIFGFSTFVAFPRLPVASPTVNNVTITGDYTLPDGSQVLLVSEVLFVSESVVSRLHHVRFRSHSGVILCFRHFLNKKNVSNFQFLVIHTDASRQRDATAVGLPVVRRPISVPLIPGAGA